MNPSRPPSSPVPAEPRPAAGTPGSRPPHRWIPVRSLGPEHRARIENHLLELDEHDLYLRFGYRPSRERIHQYVQELDFERDELFGIFNRRLEIVAMAHLALVGPPPTDAAAVSSAEFAVSVRARSRGRGYGMRLFDRAVMHARNRGIGWLTIHALSENVAMLSLARKAGATVLRHGSEAEARLALPPEDWSSRLEEAVETQAAELNYRFKVQAHLLDGLLGAITHTSRNGQASVPRSPDR
jgi:GNAT superfamily N-acetyltransferase